jgi:hypothetical protein
MLIAHDAARQMLARDLPSLKVEGVAVAVVGRHAEDADVAVVFRPSHLTIVGNVAPHEIAALRVPGRAFRPERAGEQPLDRGVRLGNAHEAWVDGDDVGIPEIGGERSIGTEVALRGGDGGERRRLFRLRHRAARAERDRSRADRHRPNERAAGNRAAVFLI